MTHDNHWYEISGAIPPFSLAQAGEHTMAPLVKNIESKIDFENIFPGPYQKEIEKLILSGVELRKKLQFLKSDLESLVGESNLSFRQLDREAYSSDSMEHRAFIPEAVFTIYSSDILRKLVAFLYENKIPMIPYGEGGGYNMGVVPMAPCVTISLRGINDIGEIKKTADVKYEITVGAGLPFLDLLAHLDKHAYVLRCVPNTPRAATGGIVATGSQAGKKAFEVVLRGRAIIKNGLDVKFELSESEKKLMNSIPFLMANKFFSIPSADSLDLNKPLPISTFVGSEGTAGFIYEVTFEIEKKKKQTAGIRLQLSSEKIAVQIAREIKKLDEFHSPFYFEFLSGFSVRKYLLEGYQNEFVSTLESCLILGLDAHTPTELEEKLDLILKIINKEATSSDILKSEIARDLESFDVLKKPREDLPKKLRTKCKTDMEIRFEYLEEALKIMQSSTQENVLFGHLTPSQTAICHWNIGGLDLYDEQKAHEAWEYLKRVFLDLRKLAPSEDRNGSAQFSGEHGIAGKAPFLWINTLLPEEYNRLMEIKNKLDPDHLFNPHTIFLKGPFEKALRARLLPLTQIKSSENSECENEIIEKALQCTRCNSCKICPVKDAQIRLKNKEVKNQGRLLPLKRDLIMFLEKMVAIKKENGKNLNLIESIKNWTKESRKDLDSCFYCRRCDKACPVDIEIRPLVANYLLLGNLKNYSRNVFDYLYFFLLDDHFFKDFAFKFLFLLGLVLKWPLIFLRKRNFPDWLKTYFVFPTLSFKKYTAKKSSPDDSPRLYLRFRGCFDTYGNPKASSALDWYFRKKANLEFLDLSKDLCCGFPYEASGHNLKAKKLRTALAKEISKVVLKNNKKSVVVFSSCPTCVHALNEISKDLIENKILIEVLDSVQVLERERKIPKENPVKSMKEVMLKIPCHNTTGATSAQKKLLEAHFSKLHLVDRCCGLSGTARLKHPKIGTEVASFMFEQIQKSTDVHVSGCPSCRDGILMQSKVQEAGHPQEIKVMGIFEAIKSYE